MKYLLITLLLLPLTSNAKDYSEKDIFEKAENKELIANNSIVKAEGRFVDFKIHGVVVLTGRATYLTDSGDKILMTIPKDKWSEIDLINKSEIEYLESNGYNINIDLPIELASIK